MVSRPSRKVIVCHCSSTTFALICSTIACPKRAVLAPLCEVAAAAHEIFDNRAGFLVRSTPLFVRNPLAHGGLAMLDLNLRRRRRPQKRQYVRPCQTEVLEERRLLNAAPVVDLNGSDGGINHSVALATSLPTGSVLIAPNATI